MCTSASALEAGQLLGFDHCVVQRAELIDQTVLFRLAAGVDAAAGQRAEFIDAASCGPWPPFR